MILLMENNSSVSLNFFNNSFVSDALSHIVSKKDNATSSSNLRNSDTADTLANNILLLTGQEINELDSSGL